MYKVHRYFIKTIYDFFMQSFTGFSKTIKNVFIFIVLLLFLKNKKIDLIYFAILKLKKKYFFFF